ncbi:hypothetical protein D3C80_1175690 [compost metagenome]
MLVRNHLRKIRIVADIRPGSSLLKILHRRVVRSLTTYKLSIGNIGGNRVRRIWRKITRILKLRISVLCLLISGAIHHRIDGVRCVRQRGCIAVSCDVLSLT